MTARVPRQTGRALVYLHGFASSPNSSKARFFMERARGAGLECCCPDLNEPEFTALTVTRMLAQVDALVSQLPQGPVALIGSSLGAFVALHAAARRARSGDTTHPVDRLVFLAPALDLVPSLEEEFGPAKMGGWESTGELEVFHYADNAPRMLGWQFIPDARQYDSDAVRVEIPTLIYQGMRDEVVRASSVERWAASRPWVTLRLVDDGHQLLGHLDQMWNDVSRFVGAPGA